MKTSKDDAIFFKRNSPVSSVKQILCFHGSPKENSQDTDKSKLSKRKNKFSSRRVKTALNLGCLEMIKQSKGGYDVKITFLGLKSDHFPVTPAATG